ncbi:High-affinity carbon uptake protein Hat/HatR [Amycolatopsis camponoti]|uniref:High-affinity carbon uptake protein Hat/HatR n=1 Tax=Amycolatopsis camponoti TaxID=2606593 RepID=A0A6I8M3N1_9PSEU|nr:WD40 repeat domain-containing protein [Amycolatopsis camponoti]VVJ22609.1 High-affinity carbon uptake protein Hat/HatR [Amycolatopsis camponoti]
MSADTTRPRRYLIATAIAHYPNAPQLDKPGLVEARDQIITLFTEDLGYEHVHTLGLDPTREQLPRLLRAFCRDEARHPEDIVAVYITGHGEVLDDTHEHVLLTSDADPDDVEDAMRTAHLAQKMLHGTRVRRVLLMLDTCYSGHGGNELTAAAITAMTQRWGDEPGSGLAVITSAQPAQQAETGAFPRLLRDAIQALPTAGSNPAALPLDALVAAMNTNASRPGYQTIGYGVTGLTGEIPPFLPNPRHDLQMTEVDLAIQQAREFETQADRRDTELRTRLLVRAMGGSSNGTGGWWFAGRHAALLEVTAWLRHPNPARPLQVVTGNPGSGKTAVLGLIATLTHPERRATVPLHSLALPAAAVPQVGAVDVAIYAQSLTTDQVLAGIAAAVHSRADTPGRLLDDLLGRDTPLTVLVDALDEASDPDHLVRSLLRPLAEHAAGRLRLLLGTRDFLLDLLGLRRDTAIDLDADRYADPLALTTYAARGLLEAHPDSPYRDQPPELLRAVADAVATAAHPSFLVARITSATLAAQPDAADPRDPAWRRSLPRLPGEAMRRDLDTRLGRKAAMVRDLLRPLAFAEGQGLPWEDIWAAVASRAAGASYTDDDLFWLRRHAGSYVVEATEGGHSTYRLYHRALADYLREDVDATAAHKAIVDVLLTRVPRALAGSRDWTRAHPYTLRHLATHAALAGEIDALVADTEYLVHAEPGTLLPALHRTSTDAAALIAAVYRCSADTHRQLPPLGRRQLLAADAARFRATRLHHELSAPLVWRPRWATGGQTTHALHTTLTGAVVAVACSTLDGRPVAVTTSHDGTAWVWDLATGTTITTFTGHAGAVVAVACSTLDGRPVAVTTSDDDTTRVWDLATGTTITTFTGHIGAVVAVACSTLNGRPVAVTGGSDGTAWVWDLATGTTITTFTGHAGAVVAVACSTLNGRPLAVTGGSDQTARVWDLATGTTITTTGHSSPVLAVACSTLNGHPVDVTVGHDAARVWDLATGTTITTFTGHTYPMGAVACSTLNGRPIAVTASYNTARVWDLATGTTITTFTTHTDSVVAVACGTLDGRPVAVTASYDGTVRVWSFLAEAFRASAALGHSGAIHAQASTVLHGCPVAVTASYDGTARVWDLATGTTITTFTGHSYPVGAVACSTLDGRPVAVTGGSDGTAWVWDLATGTTITAFTSRYPVGAVACSTLDGRPVAVTASHDRTARVWDLATGTTITDFTGHTGAVLAVACNTLDGRSIAVTGGSDDTARVWDLATRTTVTTFTRHTGAVTAVACHTLDGRPVAVTTSHDRTARVWDLATGTTITDFTGHTGAVLAAACNTLDGRPVAVTASHDGTARIWDLSTGEEVAVFDIRGIGAVAFGPGGVLMIAAGWDLIVFDRVAQH